MQAITTLDETSMSSITSTTSSQTSLNDYDWLVGRTVWVKWFLHKQDLWYKCEVFYGETCEYVVQSTKDSITRFPGVYEFFPSGFDFNNERADHVWQLTYFDTSNMKTPPNTISKKCRKIPRPGDLVMVKWTSWGVNPPWYCCAVRKGHSKNCPLVVESYKTSEPSFTGAYAVFSRMLERIFHPFIISCHSNHKNLTLVLLTHITRNSWRKLEQLRVLASR